MVGEGAAGQKRKSPDRDEAEAAERAEREAKRRAAVNLYVAATQSRRQSAFDHNGKVADLICDDTISVEEGEQHLFKHPGVNSLPGFTTDGRWHAVFPLLTQAESSEPAGVSSGSQEPDIPEDIHQAFNRFFSQDQDAQRADRR